MADKTYADAFDPAPVFHISKLFFTNHASFLARTFSYVFRQVNGHIR